MSTQNNPFVLPGLGQTGDSAGNPMMASLEMMQQAWAGLAGPGGLVQAMPIPMSLEDLDRRIAELRTVENWLKLNQSMLSSTIQGMEVQRATIATLKSFAGAVPTGDASADSGSAAAAAQSATQAWWNLMQQQFDQLASAAASSMAGTAASPTATHTAESTAAASPAPKAPAKRAASRKRSTATKSTKTPV